MREITSSQNSVVKGMRALKEARVRAQQGRMLVEGEKMIREAVSCGLTPFETLIDAQKREKFASLAAWLAGKGAEVYFAPERLIGAVSDTKTPQGAVAVFSLPVFPEAPGEKVLALDAVQDPGNVGTIWRTADAAGFSALYLGEGSADPYSPKVQRSAMGSAFRVPVKMGGLAGMLAALKKEGYQVVAGALDGVDFAARPALGRRLVIVIGNEARGVSPEALALADVKLRLPMRGGAESLNAAVAAGILMYALTVLEEGK